MVHAIDGDRAGPARSVAFLAGHARAALDAMRGFLSHELATKAGFHDLVTMIQVTMIQVMMIQVMMPVGPNPEMARNYWVELDCGHPIATHAALLDAAAMGLGIGATHKEAVLEARALSNLMMSLACNRCFAYHAVGALGAIGMTAPGRVS